ncbi:hypothetical protein BGZ61DRAFT_425844 [Ilyonectria robusta]|uniref:uncharacterized protein n=1 Tax=Ilyonectria robusta TaxID=1079257 RepID=UPI001E8D867C|nr:uncharacterized protein BGZ61DRAFT_425844 [Ilyonectria robusta]KAH8679194.1 hypothetical protein BGZ61DRAFT_425844 [Ilyonectria robusta]
MAFEDPAIPKGSTVLVTGASGWVGSNVADQFLAYGYKVRGTTRDVNKAAWMKETFEKKYGSGVFELVSVPDMVADGAYDEAVKGVTAVAHTASVMTYDADPNKVIPAVIAGSVNALKAAYAELSVKRFVLTSSSTAAVLSSPGKPKVVVTKDTYNEEAVKIAWSEPPYDARHGGYVYAASKAQGEQAVRRFYEENRAKRPDLVVNAVLPNVVFGKTLDLQRQGYQSSPALVASLYRGEISPIHHAVNPQYFVDASDVGALHVAGAILPDVKDERIFGFAGRFNWDDVLAIFRKHEPEKTFPDNFSDGRDPNEIEPASRAEQLLQELGRPGWVGLEQVIVQITEDLRTSNE